MRTRNSFAALASFPGIRAAILLVLVLVVLAIGQPTALGNYGIILSSVVDVWLVALALTPLLILGEIDLSVGATMAVAAVVAAQVSDSLIIAIPVALLAGALIGLVNGILVVQIGINSFVTTLGMMIALQGLALAIAGGGPVPLHDIDTALGFSAPLFGGITADIIVAVVVTIIVWYFITQMPSGRDLFAIGGNEESAVAAGIPVKSRKILAFVLCSILSSLAGVVITLNLVAASPILGSTVMLMAIAAAVLGGATLSGGRGSIIGATIGAIALGGINVGLQMAGLDTSVVNIVVGLILFAAVVLTKEGADVLQIKRLLKPKPASSPTISSSHHEGVPSHAS